jgi:hypothetical protein
MKLPDAQAASVPERKIAFYLLNPAHPAGDSLVTISLTRENWRAREMKGKLLS